jgi:hypothetical protein
MKDYLEINKRKDIDGDYYVKIKLKNSYYGIPKQYWENYKRTKEMYQSPKPKSF